MNENEKVVIQNNTFTGVKWDGEAIESINIVARALLNLTEIFKSQEIHIEAMLKVENPKINIPGADYEGHEPLISAGVVLNKNKDENTIGHSEENHQD